MQGFHPLFDGYPAFLSQETDTATARNPVPVYYIHSLAHPFCRNARCACHRGSRDIARLFGYLTEGVVTLRAAATLLGESNEASLGDGAGTLPTTHTSTELGGTGAGDLPVSCQLYGHSWELTGTPFVKECALCGIRGYCQGCTPIAPQGTHPFSCTAHTRASEAHS
jgi:hypothetical protein